MLPPKLNSDRKGNQGEEVLKQNKDSGVDFGKKPHPGEEKASVVKEKKRLEDLDIFKGFLIFFVVLGHLLLPVKDSPYPIFEKAFFLIYSFHMPAFVFLSGYLIYAGWCKKGIRFRNLLSYALLYIFMMCFFMERRDYYRISCMNPIRLGIFWLYFFGSFFYCR